MDNTAQELTNADQPSASNNNEPGAFTASEDDGTIPVHSMQRNENSSNVKNFKKVFPSDQRDQIRAENEELKRKVSDLHRMLAENNAGPKGDIVNENRGLKKRNNMLLATNGMLCQKAYDLQAKINSYESEIKELNENLHSLREEYDSRKHHGSHECSIQNQPVGDSDCPVSCNSEIDKKDESGKVFSRDPTNEQLTSYLSDYHKAIKILQSRNQALEDQSLVSRQTIAKQHVAMQKLLNTLESVRKERDDLAKVSFLKATTSVDDSQSLPPSNSQVKFESTSTETLLIKQEHEQNKISDYEKKFVEMNREIARKENHIVDQEVKMEKLLKQIHFIENDKKELEKHLEELRKLSTIPRNNDIDLVIAECEKYKNQVYCMTVEMGVLRNQIDKLKGQLNAKENEVSREVYEVQLKAFQDDWMAEHEEKRKILEDNEKLRQQLEMTHITSPPIMPTHASLPNIPYNMHYMPGPTTIPPRAPHPYSQRCNTSTIAPQHVRGHGDVASHHPSSPPDAGDPNYFPNASRHYLRRPGPDDHPPPNAYPANHPHYQNPDPADRMPDQDQASPAYPHHYRPTPRR